MNYLRLPTSGCQASALVKEPRWDAELPLNLLLRLRGMNTFRLQGWRQTEDSLGQCLMLWHCPVGQSLEWHILRAFSCWKGAGHVVDVGSHSPRLLLIRFLFISIFAISILWANTTDHSFYTGHASLFQGDDGWKELPASELPRNWCSISGSPLCCHMCTLDSGAREDVKLRGISTNLFQQSLEKAKA